MNRTVSDAQAYFRRVWGLEPSDYELWDCNVSFIAIVKDAKYYYSK